jgi:aminoglycoside phosphotransferase (APT) family kinase protein
MLRSPRSPRDREGRMGTQKMHDDEVSTDETLIRRLLAAQFPQWAHLPLRPVESAGTDNAIYRLGHDLAIRLPRIASAAGQVEKEQEWLPRLAPHLPLAIPAPLALGAPGAGYPWRWSIVPWLDGENPTLESLTDPRRAVIDMARFLAALRRIDTTAGPPPGEHNFGRGVPLAQRDRGTRAAIAALEGMIDTAAVIAAWEAALAAPGWAAAPVWIHGDLSSGNLLAVDGQLSAVIDWGGLGVGDPACDLMIAWTLFTGESRAAFRAALDVDDATWTRGKGWALSWALIFIPYYLETNPSGVRTARHTIAEVLAD